MQNGNSDSKISYPVAANKFRREERWGAAVTHHRGSAGVESVTVDDFAVLPAVTEEVAQWVLTKKGECLRVDSQALASRHHRF